MPPHKEAADGEPLVVITAGPLSAALHHHFRHLNASWNGPLNLVVDVAAPSGQSTYHALKKDGFFTWPANKSQLHVEFRCDVNQHPFSGWLGAISLMNKLAMLGVSHVWCVEDDVMMPGTAPRKLWKSRFNRTADLVTVTSDRARPNWHWHDPKRCFLPECRDGDLFRAQAMLNRVSARLIRAVHATHQRPKECAFFEASFPTVAHRHKWRVETWSNDTGALGTIGISLGLRRQNPPGITQCFVPGMSTGNLSDEMQVASRGLTRPSCPVDRVYHPAKMSTWT